MQIFCGPNSVSDSVSHAESHDLKILTRFLGNSILEFSIKMFNCVGSSNMRCRILIKLRLIAIFNSPVILGCFSMWVGFILIEPTQF